jgi:hypothetical protein
MSSLEQLIQQRNLQQSLAEKQLLNLQMKQKQLEMLEQKLAHLEDLERKGGKLEYPTQLANNSNISTCSDKGNFKASGGMVSGMMDVMGSGITGISNVMGSGKTEEIVSSISEAMHMNDGVGNGMMDVMGDVMGISGEMSNAMEISGDMNNVLGMSGSLSDVMGLSSSASYNNLQDDFMKELLQDKELKSKVEQLQKQSIELKLMENQLKQLKQMKKKMPSIQELTEETQDQIQSETDRQKNFELINAADEMIKYLDKMEMEEKEEIQSGEVEEMIKKLHDARCDEDLHEKSIKELETSSAVYPTMTLTAETVTETNTEMVKVKDEKQMKLSQQEDVSEIIQVPNDVFEESKMKIESAVTQISQQLKAVNEMYPSVQSEEEREYLNMVVDKLTKQLQELYQIREQFDYYSDQITTSLAVMYF